MHLLLIGTGVNIIDSCAEEERRLTRPSKYFQEETDQKIAIYAFKRLRKILAYPALAACGIGQNNGEVAPGQTVQSDAEILE
jgi:hypothetical protein